MTKIRATKILFDLDGTLVDTAVDLHAATNHVLEKLGRKQVALDQVRHMTGFGALKLIERGLEATGGVADLNLERLRVDFLEYYRANLSVHSRPYEGCVAMLEYLKQSDFKLGVCTNKPIDMAIPLLKDLGISTFFDATTGGDSFAFKKPDKRHLFATSDMLRGSGQTVMIGDSSPDIKAAKSAKYPVIAVSYGYSDVPLAGLAPNHIVNSLSEIPSLLELDPS